MGVVHIVVLLVLVLCSFIESNDIPEKYAVSVFRVEGLGASLTLRCQHSAKTQDLNMQIEYCS
jgi:hypothetical protein